MSTAAPAPLESVRPGSTARRQDHGFFRSGLARFLDHPGNITAALVVLAGVVLATAPAAAAAPGATTMLIVDRFQAPIWSGGTSEHLLGTDNLGRDLLIRLIYAARFSMAVTLLAACFAALVGVPAGLVSGFLRGWVDVVIARLIDMQMAFPAVFLAIAVLAVAGSSFWNLVLVLVLVDWAPIARVIRSAVFELRERDFIAAARVVGASDRRIILRHLAPNVVSPAVVLTTYAAARVLLAESSLSFLGLGISPPATTWGGMVGDGRNYLYDAWWVSTIPGALVAAMVLAFSFLGDGLRDAFDPRMK